MDQPVALYYGIIFAFYILITACEKETSMDFETSRVKNLVAKALDYRAMRQDMIASNIANADTPFYRPRDVRFEDALAQEKAKIFAEPKKELQLAQTNNSHMPLSQEKNSTIPTTFFRDGHMARNDGNSVDLDVETTEMSKNSVMFNALIQANKKDTLNFRSVIDASSKVS